METLFSVNTQTRSNLSVSVPTRTRRRLGTNSIRLRVNIISGSGELRCRLDWVMPDGVTGHTDGVFRGAGFHEIGFNRKGPPGEVVSGDIQLGGSVEVVGTVRFNGALVAVDQGEDVT